jgi:hypothetical protein
MSDRRKFTAPPTPPGFDEEAPLREVFLFRFTPEDAARWRHLANLVQQAFREGDVLLPKEHEESSSWRELNAVLQDLRFSQYWLSAVLASTLEHSSLDLADTRICLAAVDASVELGRLCDRLAEVLQ